VLPGFASSRRRARVLQAHRRSGLIRASWGPSSFGCAKHARDARTGALGRDDAGVRRTTPDRGSRRATDFSTANFFGLIHRWLTAGAPSWSSALAAGRASARRWQPPGASAGTVASRRLPLRSACPSGDSGRARRSDGVCAELGAGCLTRPALRLLGTAGANWPARCLSRGGSAGAAARIAGLRQRPLARARPELRRRKRHGLGGARSRRSISQASSTAALAAHDAGRARRAVHADAERCRHAALVRARAGGLPRNSRFSHSADELSRAVCEGIAIELAADARRAVRVRPSLPSELRLTGGGARSDQWVATARECGSSWRSNASITPNPALPRQRLLRARRESASTATPLTGHSRATGTGRSSSSPIPRWPAATANSRGLRTRARHLRAQRPDDRLASLGADA